MYPANPDKIENSNGIENMGSSPIIATFLFILQQNIYNKTPMTFQHFIRNQVKSLMIENLTFNNITIN